MIIGGTGTISTPITRFLVEEGHEVILFNRGRTEAEIPGNCRVITGDRKKLRDLEAAIDSEGTLDCIIDMVCFRPEEARDAVTVFALRTGQYIFCSTVDVYTKSGQIYPISEEAERRPLASFPYAHNKARCENIFFKAFEREGFPVTVIRPALTYREGRGSPLLHSFGWGTYHLDRLKKGKKIIMHGNGRSIWPVAHSEDVARAFTGAVENENAVGRAYNVTGEEWMTWNYYWETAAEVMGAPEPSFVYIPADLLADLAPRAAEWCRENFQHNNIFDNTRAREDLGYRYTISWREGFQRCYNWLKEHGEIEDCGNYPFYDQIIEIWERAREKMLTEVGAEGDLQENR